MEVNNLRCSDCKRSKDCPNLLNKRISLAKPTFLCQATCYPCLKFQPTSELYEEETIDMNIWWQEFERQWLPKPISSSTVALNIDGDTNVLYHVRLSDWIDGTIFDGEKLKVTYKTYYKQTRKHCGYELVKETSQWIELKKNTKQGNAYE